MEKIIKKCFRIIGVFLVTVILISVLPVGVPKLFGYEVYNIISGSMEPALPVGSAIYVEEKTIENIEVGEVAVYQVGNSVIAHRVISIDLTKKELITKGDANQAQDMNPVSSSQLIGSVKAFVPKLGYFTSLYTTTNGKIYLLIILIAGVIFQILGREKEKENKKENKIEKSTENEADTKQKKLILLIRIAICLIAVILLVLVGYIVKIMSAYKSEEDSYTAASETFTELKTDKAVSECPIEVDFEALWEVNPEIVGWIYCEDTVIDYPICQASDDDYYINHGYDRSQNKCGAIFLEAENKPDFSDQNNILYGHHMRDKSMFASLANWGLQSYYDEHPVMWLLTPDKNYKIILFSQYTTSAISDTYSIFRNNSSGLQEYIDNARNKSSFTPEIEDIVCGEDSRFVVLSTCAYSFENARSVLHGIMVEQ